MLIELRSYDFAPGRATAYAELFRREGLPLITRHLPLVGYFMTEVGTLNRLHHLWAYESLTERAAKRARFMQDRDWTDGFLPRGLPLVARQESRLLSEVTGSTALAEAIAGAGRAIAAEPAEAPLLADGWFAFGMGDLPPEAALIGRWRIVAGTGAGSTITLRRFDAAPALPSDDGSNPFDLCRALSFSPLA